MTARVLGPRTLDQLTSSLPALDITIDDKTNRRLDELFPGPAAKPPMPTPGREALCPPQPKPDIGSWP